MGNICLQQIYPVLQKSKLSVSPTRRITTSAYYIWHLLICIATYVQPFQWIYLNCFKVILHFKLHLRSWVLSRCRNVKIFQEDPKLSTVSRISYPSFEVQPAPAPSPPPPSPTHHLWIAYFPHHCYHCVMFEWNPCMKAVGIKLWLTSCFPKWQIHEG